VATVPALAAARAERVIAPEGGDSILKKPSHLAWGCPSVPRARLGLSDYYPLGPQGLFQSPDGGGPRGPRGSPKARSLLITQDRETGWRASDTVPAASLPPPKAAAPGGGGGSTATAAAAPTSGSAREQVLEALADSRGMWVDTDAKTEVCARVDARRVLDCMHLSVRIVQPCNLCIRVARTRCITLAGLAVAAEQPAAGLRLAEDRARRARAQAAARRGGRAGAGEPDAALFGGKVLGHA